MIENNFEKRWRTLIEPHLERLNENKHNKNKKEIEIVQCGKFLSIINDGFVIKAVREEPDFIIENKSDLIGLEMVRVNDSSIMQIEGSWEKVNKRVQEKYQQQIRFISHSL